jgi:pyruvate formate lyase activating enzyme
LKGVIFNIQRYSIHDGPGIRTTLFLKGCPLKCFWCQNPESQRKKPEVFLYKDRCTGCGQCVAACSTGASRLLEKKSTIDRDKCIGCGECVGVCPNEARKLMGRSMTVDKVMQEVVKDSKFYEDSGGGVTLSGGEPTAQPQFALAVLRNCKEAGLHTTLETCGYVSWQTMDKLLEYTDLVLYDVKCLDAKKHYAATGRSNAIILQNIKRIAGYKPIRVRVPMIPGFNDSSHEVRAIANFVKKELGSIEIELLSYNKLGESKCNLLDRDPVHLEDRGDEHMEKLKLELLRE